jgi:hypothetical protein
MIDRAGSTLDAASIAAASTTARAFVFGSVGIAVLQRPWRGFDFRLRLRLSRSDAHVRLRVGGWRLAAGWESGELTQPTTCHPPATTPTSGGFMKKLLVGVLVLSCVVPVFAADPAQIAAAERSLVRASHVNAGRAGTMAALKTGYEQWIFIPAAGSLQGNFGTFYKSDLMIANYRNVPQIVRFRWLPQGGSGFSTTTQRVTIPANTAVSYTDAVATLLHYSGLGAIEMVARTADDSIDLNAQIDAFSRIWTPQPNTTLGTVSQNFGGSGIFQIEGNTKAYALGLVQDTKYRTNVGILNADFFSARTWTIQVVGLTGSTSFTVTVPAFSMVQTNIPAGTYGALYVVFTPPAEMQDSWTAYASTTDNGTGDGWVSPATQITNQ